VLYSNSLYYIRKDGEVARSQSLWVEAQRQGHMEWEQCGSWHVRESVSALRSPTLTIPHAGNHSVVSNEFSVPTWEARH
jgi:hypothetical protein